MGGLGRRLGLSLGFNLGGGSHYRSEPPTSICRPLLMRAHPTVGALTVIAIPSRPRPVNLSLKHLIRALLRRDDIEYSHRAQRVTATTRPHPDPLRKAEGTKMSAVTRATVREVARRAGVSPMTVSRVVNGSRRVRPETRLAVGQGMRGAGYVPNGLR